MKTILTILLFIAFCNVNYAADFRKIVREMESKRHAEKNNVQNQNTDKPVASTQDATKKVAPQSTTRQVVFEEDSTNAYVRTDDDLVNFTFNQVEVATFVKLIGDITDKKFVIDEDVVGLITVISPKIKVTDVYPLFTSILESVNCAVIGENDILRIVKLQDKRFPVAPLVPSGTAINSASGFITRIVFLENISADEIVSSLKSIGEKSTNIIAVKETNHIVLIDTAANVKRLEEIINAVDKPGLARITEVIPLQYASAEDMAQQLSDVFGKVSSNNNNNRNSNQNKNTQQSQFMSSPTIVASPGSNSLIINATKGQIADLKDLLEKMDIDSVQGSGRLNAIILKYISAKEAAASLNSLLQKSEVKTTRYNTRSVQRKIAIHSLDANNALIIDATPGEFEVIKRLISQLDYLPEQVHISCLIIEHTLGNTSELGAELAGLQMPSAVGDITFQGGSIFNASDNVTKSVSSGTFPGGLTFGAAYGTSLDDNGNVQVSYPIILNIAALKRNSNFKVLSDTSLGVQDNKEASVRVVNQVPVLKSTVNAGAGTATDVIQNIDRIDVGITFTITPHIIPGGEVLMQLNPTISAITDPGDPGAYTPTISKREVKTTVIVPDGKMIIIAGLTREDTITSKSKVPILGDIPILGFLFRWDTKQKDKSNIIIIVQPKIVTSIASQKELLEAWEDKTAIDVDEAVEKNRENNHEIREQEKAKEEKEAKKRKWL
ncbi:MAG: type II secretion system secretin GspD [Kiritimatiellae bacterium]|jgi:general secretion pathway protein D|nr:type II secretion system secretin GspD [Kiritimatiellia bacterium]